MIGTFDNKRQVLNAMLDATRHAKFFITTERLYQVGALFESLASLPIIGGWLYWRTVRTALAVLTAFYYAYWSIRKV